MRMRLPMAYFMDEDRVKKNFDVYTQGNELCFYCRYVKRTFKIVDSESDRDAVVMVSI